MEKRLGTFLAASLLLILVNMMIQAHFFPPQKVAQRDKAKAQAKADAGDAKDGGKQDAGADGAKQGDAGAAKQGDDGKAAAGGAQNPAAAPLVEAAPEPPVEPQWVSLGSANAADPYRMLVTLTNVGAAIERAELNNDRYRDLENRSGYSGFLATTDAPNNAGSLIRVVGRGTPAAVAGLKPGDVVQAIDGKIVASADAMEQAIQATTPGQTIEIKLADGRTVSASLNRRPLQVLRPEFNTKALDVVSADHDPFSMLFTLERAGNDRLAEDAASDQELAGVNLRAGAWEVLAADADEAVFRKRLPALGLEVRKRYSLAKVDPDLGSDQPAYHLDMDIELRNIGSAATQVAYRLDGPTGVVLEGAWYGSKINSDNGHWFRSVGLRDVIGKFKNGGSPGQVSTAEIAGKTASAWPTSPVQYVAVDAQYFTAAVIPEPTLEGEFLEVRPILAGDVPKETENHKLTDVSFRMRSQPFALSPQDEPVKHSFTLFLGPRKPALLDHYGPRDGRLGSVVYYGWFDWVAEPMLWMLHLFYSVVRNYGVAIVMLTLLVRGCLFPLSKKQAISAQKMQTLQPEMKAIQEKYKKQPEQLRKAQQELNAKHNFNPFGGCLMAFIQLPIFMGLYRSLAVDVELRQAPLLSDSIRWCSNLAAPDMLWDWSHLWDKVGLSWVNQGNGMFAVGPYLNVFPLITIALFLWQQKMFMPPATDDATAMQQKIMKYMMVFMGITFFKVPSGLCLYFIASSTWGIAERKLLHPPQDNKPSSGSAVVAPAGPSAGGKENGRNGDSPRKPSKSKQRGRK